MYSMEVIGLKEVRIPNVSNFINCEKKQNKTLKEKVGEYET